MPNGADQKDDQFAERTEQLIDRLNRRAADLERSAPAEMLAIAQQAHELAVAADYKRGIAWSLVMIGRANWRLGNLGEANNSLQQAQAVGVCDPLMDAEIDIARGAVHVYLKAYDKAFWYYQRGLALAKERHNRPLQARLLNNIGEIYRQNGDYPTALDYYQQSFAIHSDLPGMRGRAVSVANVGCTYRQMNDLPNAKLYASHALEIAREQNDQMVESASLHDLGRIALQEGQKSLALQYFGESLSIYRQTKETIHATQVLLDFHRLYFADDKIELSLQYLHEALQRAQEADSLSLVAEVYVELTKVYASVGDLKQALHYVRLRDQTLLAIERAEKRQVLRAIRLQIDADKSLREKETYRALSLQLEQKAKELETRTEQLEDAYQMLQALGDIGRTITATLSFEQIFGLVHRHLRELMRVDAFGVALFAPKTNTLDYEYLIEAGEPLPGVSISLDSRESLAVSCYLRQQGFLVNSLSEDVSAHVEKLQSCGAITQAMMFQPLTLERETIGVISVQSLQADVYDEQALSILGTLSSYLSVALQNARKSARLKQEIQQREQAEEELRRLNLELADLSNRDGLTNIANRRRFDEFAQTVWSDALKRRQSISLLMLDVDNFKEYNDVYGHLVGDEVLKQIAHVLRDNVSQPGNLVARFGGDEFVVLLPNRDCDGAVQTANHLTAALADWSVSQKTTSFQCQVTVSIGVATLVPSESDNIQDLLAHSDQALYQAKTNGRACISVYQG